MTKEVFVAKSIWTLSGRQSELDALLRQVATERLSRRRFARRALALGVSATAVASALRAGGTLAWQMATPEGWEPIGEELDLANLSPEIPEPTEPVTITFASWVNETPMMNMLRDSFQEVHPNITVEFQGVPAEEMDARLTTQVAGGNPPDSVFVDMSSVVDYASRNALLDLEPYIAKSVAVKRDDYIGAFLDSVLWDDKMYGLPYDGETTGLFYRKDLFEAAGIAEPPKTWEELEAAAQALTTEGHYGYIMFAPEAAYYWYPYLWQNGGELMSEDGTTVLFNSDAGKEAAEFYVGLTQYSSPDYLNSNSYDGRVAFATGQVAMYVAGAWFASVIQDEYPDINDLWDAAPLPEKERCATTIAGDALIIPEQGQNHDAAWKWVEFLSAPQNMALWALGIPGNPGSVLPPRTSLLEDPNVFDLNPILEGFAQQMECGVTGGAPNPLYGEVEVALNDALGRAIYGEIDAATALDEAALEAEDILSR
ncbi:MAG: extracellular solute-binding protein family 1 [Thermomicrobiales bacterium]|nr:extracellular solute-binding protein family 1 [Thermomicrobiales bacterium]MDF3016509.1 extracellular solute-binding protein family 1 [Thermomicrobiales bacterium]